MYRYVSRGFRQQAAVIAMLATFGCGNAQAALNGHEWSGILSASVGNDDNLTLGDASSVASQREDNYLEVLGFASRYLSGVRDDGVRISGTLFTRQYESENDFGFTLVGVGVGYDKKFTDWKTRFEAGYDYIEYGGDTYEKISKLAVEGRHHLTQDAELRLRYEADFISAPDTLYRNLEGTMHQFRAETRLKQDSNRYRLSYTLETNDRDDFRTATTFTSSSPVRHILRANARIPFAGKWEGEIDARYRKSRYRDKNLFSNGSSKTRDDERFRARLGIEYKYTGKTRFFGRYENFNNDSNIDTYSYDRNLISVGIQHTF